MTTEYQRRAERNARDVIRARHLAKYHAALDAICGTWDEDADLDRYRLEATPFTGLGDATPEGASITPSGHQRDKGDQP